VASPPRRAVAAAGRDALGTRRRGRRHLTGRSHRR
jgi:hypothetical protein